MRLNKIQPKTEYATCEGVLVVTGAKVVPVFVTNLYPVIDQTTSNRKHLGAKEFGSIKALSEARSWTVERNTTVRTMPMDEARVAFGIVEGASDPWASCRTDMSRFKRGSYSFVLLDGKWFGHTERIRPGTKTLPTYIEVKAYKVDADGKKVGTGERHHVIPRDIGGTWLEYMSLHAADVRFAAEKIKRAGTRNEIQLLLAKTTSATFRAGLGYDGCVSVTLSDQEAVDYLVKRRKITAAQGRKITAHYKVEKESLRGAKWYV